MKVLVAVPMRNTLNCKPTSRLVPGCPSVSLLPEPAPGSFSKAAGRPMKFRAGTPDYFRSAAVDIKARLDDRAAAEDVKPAEIIRRALVEYLDRHPA